MTDFHDYGIRLEHTLNRIDREDILPADKKLIREFVYHCQAQGVSPGRLYKLAWNLLGIKRRIPTSFRKATRKDIERLVGSINSSEWSPNTKSDAKKILKRFYKFVRTGNADKTTPYPADVAWINTDIKKNEQREPEVLTEDEVKRLISAATSTRAKAFIAVIAEGGFRVAEMLSSSVKDVLFDENGARLTVRGKTGQRTVRLITSVPLLGFYLQEHPRKGEPDAPLWYKFEKREDVGPLKYRDARGDIWKASKLAKISKKVHPHLFRHSAATRDSTYGLNERMLEIKYGWSKGSRMAARYTHIQDVQVVDSHLLGIYAGKQIEAPKPTLVTSDCPRCNEKNTPGMSYCGKCGCPLNKQELAKAGVEIEELKAKIRELEDFKNGIRTVTSITPEEFRTGMKVLQMWKDAAGQDGLTR